MANLFIIGNGFDLSHGLKTSYEDFHKYLKNKYPNAKASDYVPEYVTDGHGNDVPKSEDEVIGFIEHILCDADGDKWSNLESSIGKIDFEDYINDFDNDDEDDYDPWEETSFNEGNSISLINPILEIPFYFSKWIMTIRINSLLPQKDFIRLLNKESDFFLSFNYTKTLEYIYSIENVCHIHGVQGERLLFGHGSDYNYFSDENYGMRPGTESSFQEMHDSLKKDTQKAYEENRTFFKNLNSINKIYSYGFSFSEVDEIYIRKICNCVDTRLVTWYLNDFDDETIRHNYKSSILKCGFKGSFDSYHIEN